MGAWVCPPGTIAVPGLEGGISEGGYLCISVDGTPIDAIYVGIGIPPPVGSTSIPRPACPSGYHWDARLNQCIQNATVTVPPPSGVSRPFPPTGPINVFGAPPVVTSTTTVTGSEGAPVQLGGEGPIYVNVVNTITNSVNAATGAADVAGAGVISSITNPLTDLVGAINTGVGNAFSAIAQTLNDFESSIGGLLNNINSLVSNGLLGTIATITAQLAQILNQISQQIGGLAGAIGQAIATVIPAIVAAISNPIGALTGVLGRIEQDIAGNIAQLTQVGSDIAGGFSSLDSTLGRLLTGLESFTEATTGYPADGTLHEDLSDIVKALAGLTSTAQEYAAAPKLADFLKSPCITDYLEQLRELKWIPPEDSSILKEPFYVLAKLLASIVTWAFSVYPAALKAAEAGTQIMNEQCPQGILPPAALVEAVQRGYLTYDQAAKEALRDNIDDSRFHTLLDLETAQLTVAQLTAAFYRGIISQNDFETALHAQGYAGPQQNVLQALGVSLLSVGEATELYRRQAIDAPVFDALLKALAYDDTQRKALAQLVFRPARMQEAIDGGAAQDTLTQLGALAESDVNRIPEYVSVAAAAEGLDVDAMNQRWLAHWATGSVGSWINLYFRGQVSLETVKAAMARNFIPDSIQTTLIESSRPLLPYRTISNMLRIGQIDVQTAGQLLLQHGYTQQNAQYLISYAQRPGAAVKAKQAQATHAVSLGIAKNEYIDGSISENDYYQILLQHGYTIEGANAEIAVINAQQAMLTRKENAQLVIDEYGAGLINEQTALAQLAALGLTVYELAKYSHKLKAFRVKASKIPSESDLNHFLQLGIIDAITYKQQLVAQHYSDTAANWFLAWREHPSSTATTPAPATTATTP